MAASSPAEIIVETLSPYLGPHTARTAVRTFSERSLQLAPEALTRADAVRLTEALRPTLGALLGSERAAEVLRMLAAELGDNR